MKVNPCRLRASGGRAEDLAGISTVPFSSRVVINTTAQVMSSGSRGELTRPGSELARAVGMSDTFRKFMPQWMLVTSGVIRKRAAHDGLDPLDSKGSGPSCLPAGGGGWDRRAAASSGRYG